MPSVRNPSYVSPVAALVTAKKAALQTYMTNNAAREWITFQELRDALPAADRPNYPDGVIAAILKELGYEVMV